MEFTTLLNRYIDEVGCSAKDLAEVSGISAAAISRYRTGERTPDPDSKHLRLLASGLAGLSDGKFDGQAVHEVLATSISGIVVDYETFLGNLAMLLDTLSIGNGELARALSFDPSYISRILSGQRRPADMHAFVSGVAAYAARRSMQPENADAARQLIGPTWGVALTENERAEAIAHWLTTNFSPAVDSVGSFLEKLDTFDLADFIRAIHFDEMKVPSASLQLPSTRTYTGLLEMMDCELDFLKAAVLSKSSADVIMYSDMPLEDMASDPDFPKKWMYGMAMMLKKGLRLRMVHDTNRPLAEMMLGLEGWIPMYMTGQVVPYYLEGERSGVFNHILKVAGTVGMQGEAIVGHQAEGRYVLTKNRDEVRYLRRRAERMLEKARPLMRIVTAEEPEKLAAFMDEEATVPGDRRIIMSTLPIGSMPPGLLERMLERARVRNDDREKIRAYAHVQTQRFDSLLATSRMRLEVGDAPSDEFAAHPPALDLSGLFHQEEIAYTPAEYAEHLEALHALVGSRPNCALYVDTDTTFRNIQISICKGRNVLVSKVKDPAIHFIIEHPDMVDAFERFTAPVSDTPDAS